MVALPSLTEWESFYVITGSSGAALTGLMFVVIALAGEQRAAEAAAAEGDGVGAFGTPNIIHFGMVLLVASVITIPRRTAVSLSLCILGSAVIGLIYSILAIIRIRRQTTYRPVMEDWVWHTMLPLVAYAALLTAALLLLFRPELALDLIAAVVILLLYIGIHNAWDAALYMVTRPRQAKEL